MGKRILIVDDALFMRSMLKDILTKEGYEVIGEADNGKIACEKYTELKPDLVLLDISMPIMNGLDTLKNIKKQNPNACVIMCSAMDEVSDVVKAIQFGAKDFVVKPFERDRLLEAVHKVMG